MKNKVLKTVILFVFIFAISNIITYQHNSPFDGADYTGWPARFYEYNTGGGLAGATGRGFMPLLLIADILIVLAISITIVYLVNLIMKRKK